MTLDRRRFLQLALAGAVALPVLARAEDAPSGKPPLPFQPVGPFAEEADAVFGFFLFTCPFCRKHMPQIQAWGGTLPSPLRFGSSPIPQEPAGLQGARAFYAVRRAAPGKLDDFENTVYASIQDAQANPTDPKTYLAAARTVGIDMNALQTWWNHKQVQREVFMAKLRYERYAIEHTPSISVGGRFVLYADLTNGDYAVMLNLANGIISQMLPQFTRKPS